MTTLNYPSELPADYLYSPEEIAQILGCKKQTLAVWRCTGRCSLPYVKVGKNVRYRARDLAEFLHKNSKLHTELKLDKED